MRDPYWYTLFPENDSDPVVKKFGDIWDLQMVLGVLSFVYSAFRISV